MIQQPSILGIYPREMKSVPGRESCTPVFNATLFTKARLWNKVRGSVNGKLVRGDIKVEGVLLN